MVHVTPMIDNISCEYKSLAKFAAETATNLANECVVIVHVNIVSLDKHFNDLQLFLNRFSYKVEVLCISETRLTPRNIKYCNLVDILCITTIQTLMQVDPQFMCPKCRIHVATT